MPVTIIIGGQFGSEGKGKVAYCLAKDMNARFVIRCGGSNSGHTVYDQNGKKYIFRHLPTAALLQNIGLIIPDGSYIDIEVLELEIKSLGISPERLHIAPNAVIISDKHKNSEGILVSGIGSTGSGTGAAVADRVLRSQQNIIFAKDCISLKPYVKDVTELLQKSLENNERVLVEGTQGFGLSLLHSPYYPYVTSRDTTAAAFLSEAGLSPRDVDDIVMVIRAFPIRVGAPNSGPLPREINWNILSKEGGFTEKIEERTSVTNRIRRVARFDSDIVIKAIKHNQPNRIVLNHLDYLHNEIKTNINEIQSFVINIQNKIKKQINFVGLSPKNIIPFSTQHTI